MMNDELKSSRKARPRRSGPFIIHQSSFSIFSWPVRVYYEDTDLGGVVYYANYLKFLERARTEWLRALGVEQTVLAAKHQVIFVVRSITLEYLRPAAFNDELVVTVELEETGAVQIRLLQRVTRGAEELATARVRIACVNTATFRPVRIPSSLSEMLRRQAAKSA
jgi:acyl-CoA thioester hydrolase